MAKTTITMNAEDHAVLVSLLRTVAGYMTEDQFGETLRNQDRMPLKEKALSLMAEAMLAIVK